MKFVFVVHSLRSCWNHGNAHFLRGMQRALRRRGHDAEAWEAQNPWSLANLLAEQGPAGLDAYHATYPDLTARTYADRAALEAACADADVVLVHEWNEPWVVRSLARLRRAGGRFLLLFHDTHHRAVSDPSALEAMGLGEFDGVLAFGAALAEAYRAQGWGRRVHVWHEAADTTVFRPPARESGRAGLVWIGNWGDGERTAELEELLLGPASDARLPLEIHGVRYPPEALAMLGAHGATFRGWLPNARVPEVFARFRATIHVPRRHYATLLPGIPTIRVFEALACGIPLVSAPWDDAEDLFRPGDFLRARNRREMADRMRLLADDPAAAAEIGAAGHATVAARHSCDHRAAELLGILATLRAEVPA